MISSNEVNAMFKQFIDDMIHLTEGERLVAYWPLWLVIVLIGVIVSIIDRKK
ncbi:hypothetical protein [Paenibacillus faecis]|uniref:hypothetical protein n=1 Tax=Paenibacillus faecis TaxID=862114 RepID=UPI0014796BF9|nr:hypothetical protein [Paenibacillus faecis]